MPRLCCSHLGASIGVGALVAALVGCHAVAQTPVPAGGLRPSLDDTRDDVLRHGRTRVPASRPAPPVGQIPRFGTLPGSGAGNTGFVSTNAPRRRPRTRGAVAPAAASRVAGPLPIAGPGAPPPVSLGLAPPLSAPSGSGTPPTDPTVSSPAGTATAAAAAVGTTLGAASRASLLRRRSTPEDDPFDAVGIRAGTFVLRPAIEVMGGYDTNPARVPAGRGSTEVSVAPELQARSDWERHQLDVNLRGSYYYYPEVRLADRPSIDAKIDGRIDVTRDTRIDLEGRYLLATDYPGSPNLPADIARLPVYTDVGATVGVGQRFNRLDVALKSTVDRIVYENSLLVDGTSSSNQDRDYNQFGLQLRGNYELTPGVKPFAEADIDTRHHDLAFDRDGLQRDSDGLTPRIGTTFEITRKLTGEIATGYLMRTYKDPTLPDVRALVVDGSLLWTATALTNVKLTARSTADESVLPGVSAVLRRDAGFEVNHALRRWLVGTFKLGFGLDDYIGSIRQDHRYLASLGLTYKLTRTVQIKGEVRREWLRSNVANVDYTADVVLVGVRLQR